MKDDKKRYQIYISESLMNEFKHWCLDEKVSASQMIEWLIEEKLKEKNKGKK